MIHRVAVGIEGQVAIGAVDLVTQSADGRGRGVAAGTHADHRRRTIGAAGVIAQHTDVDGAALHYRRRVRFGARQVIDDVDVDLPGRRVAIAVDSDDVEVLGQAVGAVGGWMGFVIVEGVAVADHPARRVVIGDGQGAAQ
ncbi:hypothetical protein D9M71_513370 [compost metagenome]